MKIHEIIKRKAKASPSNSSCQGTRRGAKGIYRDQEESAEKTMDVCRGNAHMRKIFILSLLIFFMFGCATTSKGPLQSDEVRLIALDITETGTKEGEGKLYKAIIQYRHGGRIGPSAITSVCATRSWLWDT